MSSDPPVVRRGFAEDDRPFLAGLLWDAFGQKFSQLLRNRESAIRVLGSGLIQSGALTAYRAQRPVGVMLLKDRAGLESMTAHWRDYADAFGPLSGTLRLAALAFIDERPPRDVLVVDAISVDPREQGSGIGTLLLTEAEAVAGERGRPEMMLEVVAGNHGAVRLYERLGYRVTATKSAGWLGRRLLGVGPYHRMRKAL